MRLNKKQWLLMQLVALLVITGGVFLVKPYLARAINVNPAVANGMNGSGITSDPYVVTTCQNLQDMSLNLNSYYILGGNIDCSGSINWNSGAGFIPVGRTSNGEAFAGTLDGRAYAIDGLYVNPANNPSADAASGLFGKIHEGKVLNLTLTNATVYSNNADGSVGGIVGSLHQGVLANVGYNGAVIVNECNRSTTVGGLVGYLSSDGTLDQKRNYVNASFAQGSIAVSGVAGCGTFNKSIGGLIGTSGYAQVNNSYSTMAITVSGEAESSCPSTSCRAIGGLIGTKDDAGNADGEINSSYSAGSITIQDDHGQYLAYRVGGLIGVLSVNVSTTNSFTTTEFNIPPTCDNVSCDNSPRFAGALFGGTQGHTGAWDNYWYDQTRIGTDSCIDNLTHINCNAVNTDGLSPDYLKGTPYVSPINTWDIINIWQITVNQWPLLSVTSPNPPAPTNPQASIDSSSSISLSWNPTSNANELSGYTIACKLPSDTAWTDCLTGIDPSATSAIVTGLEPGTQYQFRITSQGVNYYSSLPSSDVTATTASIGFILVWDCQQLQDMNNDLGERYELANNIDCSDTINWNGGSGFEPIGNFDFQSDPTPTCFSGIFKGNNYTISNLYTDQTNTPSVQAGLFGCVMGGIIQDVKLSDPIVLSHYVAGTIISFGMEVSLNNTHVTGGVIGGSPLAAGGLIGYTQDGSGSQHNLSKNEYRGTINSTAIGQYYGGLYGGLAGNYHISDSFAQVEMSLGRGITAGGVIGYLLNPNGPAAPSISTSYAAGSISMSDPNPFNDGDPNTPDASAIGGLIGGAIDVGGGQVVFANNFASVAISSLTPDQVLGGAAGFAFGASAPNLGSTYFDSDVAGMANCVGNTSDSCGVITGQPNYFKNNSANPPLDAWNFTNIWQTTADFPVFGSAVTTGITTTVPNTPNTGQVCFVSFTGVNICTAAPQTGTTDPGTDNPVAAASASGSGTGNSVATTNSPTDEAGVLGAFKKFVRSLPAGVVIAFPYALFALLALAALVLLIELARELRRIHLLQALISKQRLLAEERDAFWHLAANYLRAPVTLIVGGAEALRESNVEKSTTAIADLAASLQKRVADIMAKIEGSSSLQAISQAQPHKAVQIARRAVFIVPVVIVALLAILGNYAAASYRNLGPDALGYAMQLAGFIVAVVLFYWVLGLLTSGKSKRKAAEELLDRQTNELANARHELIAETTNSLNPDLTKLEGMLHALPAAMTVSAPGALTTLGEGTNRLRQIVSSFAMLIKVQEGTGAVAVAPGASTVDLAGILARTRAKLTPQIVAKHLQVTAPAVPLPVQAEAELANQVLDSIIANAVDYSPEGGTVKVEAKRLQDAIQIRVSDQGQGIDSKQLAHLFQPFVRADGKSAMDMSHGGFGINLYLDKLIMEQMGGTITASSTPGKGTSFTMEWPTAS